VLTNYKTIQYSTLTLPRDLFKIQCISSHSSTMHYCSSEGKTCPSLVFMKAKRRKMREGWQNHTGTKLLPTFQRSPIVLKNPHMYYDRRFRCGLGASSVYFADYLASHIFVHWQLRKLLYKVLTPYVLCCTFGPHSIVSYLHIAALWLCLMHTAI